MRVFIVLLAIVASPAWSAEPYVPESPDTLLASVPPAEEPEIKALQHLRERLDEDPDNLDLAATYARRAIEMARATADPRYIGYAQAALSPWWNTENPPTRVRLLRATVAQRRHRFDRALADLDALLKVQPMHAQARLTRATIHTVQARYEHALRDCAALTGHAARLVVAACAATPASLSGRAEEALSALDSAFDAHRGGSRDTRAWALTSRAEIAARLGKHERADTDFRRALELADGRDIYLLAAYADFLLQRERPKAVVSLLEGRTEATTTLVRLAIAERRLGETGDDGMQARFQRHVETLAARFAAAERRGTRVHRREQAMFELHLRDRPSTALWLARANWRQQKEPADARILLAAALAGRAPGKAAPAMQWLQDNQVQAVGLRDLARRVRAQRSDS